MGVIASAQVNRNLDRWIEKSEHDAIRYWANQVRILARKSLRLVRDKDKHAPPGMPPFSHQTRGSQFVNLKWIQQEVALKELSAIVGPIIKRSRPPVFKSSKTVPERLEFGGSAKKQGSDSVRKRKRGWGKRRNYTQREIIKAKRAMYNTSGHYKRSSILIDDQGNIDAKGLSNKATVHIHNPPHPYMSKANKTIAPMAAKYLADFAKNNVAMSRWRPQTLKWSIRGLQSSGYIAKVPRTRR